MAHHQPLPPLVLRSGAWTLIGYEKRRQNNLTEAYDAEPNPSTTPKGKDLTPEGNWRVAYDQQGELIDEAYSDKILIWGEEGAFLKGNRKGVGEAFPNMLRGKE